VPRPDDLLPTLVGVVLLAGIATSSLWFFRVRPRWAPSLAIARGAAQLAVISVILTGVISSPQWIAVALLVMFAVAAGVATRRVGWSLRTATTMVTSLGAGTVLTLSVVFLTGALEFTGRYTLAIGAVIIGGSMSIATLTGRAFTNGVVDHWDEVEGWLALGAAPRVSTLALARRAVRDSIIPALDQTKTTGLVVLPGAFVGAIFGGISPFEAARFQIIVLAGILAAGATTAILVASWMGGIATKPHPPD
jgi:putative ABC transport system permease protein